MNKNSKKARNNSYNSLISPVMLENEDSQLGVLKPDCCEIKTTDRKDNIIIA